jgi:hypothetical protein
VCENYIFEIMIKEQSHSVSKCDLQLYFCTHMKKDLTLLCCVLYRCLVSSTVQNLIVKIVRQQKSITVGATVRLYISISS